MGCGSSQPVLSAFEPLPVMDAFVPTLAPTPTEYTSAANKRPKRRRTSVLELSATAQLAAIPHPACEDDGSSDSMPEAPSISITPSHDEVTRSPRRRTSSWSGLSVSNVVRLTEKIFHLVHESLVPELQQSHGLTVHGAVEVVDNTPIQYRDLATKSTYPSKEETQTGVLAFLSGWQKNSKARSSDQKAVLCCLTKPLAKRYTAGTAHMAMLYVLLRRVMYPILSKYTASAVHTTFDSVNATFESVWLACAAALDIRRALNVLETSLGLDLGFGSLSIAVAVGGSADSVKAYLRDCPKLYERMCGTDPNLVGAVLLSNSIVGADRWSFENLQANMSDLYADTVVVSYQEHSEASHDDSGMFWSVQLDGAQFSVPDLACDGMVPGPEKRLFELSCRRVMSAQNIEEVAQIDRILTEEFMTLCVVLAYKKPGDDTSDGHTDEVELGLLKGLVETFNGHLVQSGYALFGEPEDAVRCALALRSIIREFNHRQPANKRLAWTDNVVIFLGYALHVEGSDLCWVDQTHPALSIFDADD